MKSELKIVASVAFIFALLFSIPSMAEITDTDEYGTLLDESEPDVGNDVEGKQWTAPAANIAGQRVTGYELSCEVGEGQIGFCGSCSPSGSSEGPKNKDGGIFVSGGFAKVMNNGIGRCLAKACGYDEDQYDEFKKLKGAKIHGCGYQNRKTASGKVSNHAGANAIDLNKITCPNGKEITFNLKKGGSGKTLSAAKNKKPQRQTKRPKKGMNSCSHDHPPEGYNDFNNCWSNLLNNSCPNGQGGLLAAGDTPKQPTDPAPQPPKKHRGKGDTDPCHHNDHVHFSSCPGSGI